MRKALILALMGLLAGGPVFGGTALKDGDVRRIITDHIHASMPWPKDDVRVTFLETATTVPYASDLRCEVRERVNEPYIGDTVFSLRFTRGGDFVAERTVRVRIEVAFPVVVTTRAVAAGTVLAGDDLKVIKRWFMREPVNTLSSVEEVLGRKVVAAVRPNFEITRNMLREVPVVKKGELVRMVLSRGPLSITAMGQSQEDGTLGATVRVKNVTSQRVVYARVVSDSLVQVDF